MMTEPPKAKRPENEDCYVGSLAMRSRSLYLGLVILISRHRMAMGEEHFEMSICAYDQGNYTTNSSYKANLDQLLSNFTSHQIEYGFYNFSYGHDHKANAIGLCRGDIMPNACQTCLNNSIPFLTKSCPTQIEAIGWYDECMIRYSDRNFFGLMEASPGFFSCKRSNASDPDRFIQVATNLLEQLTHKAASGDSRLKFATGNAPAPSFPVIYGAVQCTPDITAHDCTDCLLGALTKIRDCCYGRLGGEYGRPSCSFRFDIDRFFQDPPASTPPPLLSNATNTTTSSSTQGHGSRIVVVIVVPIIIVAVILILIIIIIIIIRIFSRPRRPRNYSAKDLPEDEITTVESLEFDFETIRIATDGFSDANEIGKGGFGAVYKGRLPDGQTIAVKRLFQGSSEGDEEFKNEILLVAKLQHRNLVQLLGFCFKENEKLLIYEFAENSSLEKILFNPVKRESLDWKTRYNIIQGIVRGLIYLHEDSQLRIIHRDLKASNILLDAEMNAKISDFGTAKLFGRDQTQGDTKRIIGTYGYMAPEYAWNGHFSVKSDVFSFGVLVLEIVTGQKKYSSSITNNGIVETLVSYAWRNWQKGNALGIVDPCLKSGLRMEMARCIHVGLLCVQEKLVDRPTMTTILLMLNNDSISLARPSQPAFFINDSCPQISRQSKNNSTQNLNGMSITELYPR